MNRKLREGILAEIDAEREDQCERYGYCSNFDFKNTINDWASYICGYAIAATGLKVGRVAPAVDTRDCLIKVAALAVAAIEMLDENGIAPRHYDEEERLKT